MGGPPQSKIWVYAQHYKQGLSEVSLEVMGKARELAGQTGWGVGAVLLGENLASLAEEVCSFGLDEVLVADDPLLADYCNQAYAKVLVKAVGDYAPEVFLFGATALGTDLASRLAARLRTGLSAHCLDLELSPAGELLAVVPGWGGRIMARIGCRTRPQMATVSPGIFEIPQKETAKGRIIRLAIALEPADITYRVVEVSQEAAQESALGAAQVVVAGGWGVGGEEDWALVKELATALGGAVGASRPPVDEGWASEAQMIGQSGRSISPGLYIGVAISGHMHHIIGLKGDGFKVAINTDPQAPIFEHCHLGLVGDFKEIVPALIKAIEAYSNRDG